MFLALLAAAAVSAGGHLGAAIDAFERLDSYSVTLNSSGGSEIIRYFYKKPGFIRMEFVTPHKGAVLVYDPAKNEVRLRPFPRFESFVLTMGPENPLIKSSGGHTVDRSDIGVLLENAAELAAGGSESPVETGQEGESPLAVAVEGARGATVGGVHKYMFWFDKKTSLPVRAVSYDTAGRVIEDVSLDRLEVDPALPEGLFRID